MKKCRRIQSPELREENESTDGEFDYPAPADPRIYPHVSRGKSGAGGTVINQKMPSLTQGYNRHLDIIMEPQEGDEEGESVKSVSFASEDCQMEVRSSLIELKHNEEAHV